MVHRCSRAPISLKVSIGTITTTVACISHFYLIFPYNLMQLFEVYSARQYSKCVLINELIYKKHIVNRYETKRAEERLRSRAEKLHA